MSQNIKYYDQNLYKDFYAFYKSLDHDIKKQLRKLISKKCRVEEKTVRKWISEKSVPVYQSNRVTESVQLIAVHLDLAPCSILEKVLFPQLMMQIMYYDEN